MDFNPSDNLTKY